MKGGTAINLFYRNMPRLSVDIDLTYLPIEDRTTSLRGIDEALGGSWLGCRKAIATCASSASPEVATTKPAS